ncbi:amidohydrolase family protein [Aurantibacter crassamenti]|uniref:amidohydrolase family protein n=1 Tax=Aurantibacter crassamenti TaxID=1837375 RepID=UPI001939CFB2|nr:amidohydrolase family protein [Aurantibacter crassamenti]MBM1107171.1 amidohydrolase family protein [Aurantibacter crassamenti]
MKVFPIYLICLLFTFSCTDQPKNKKESIEKITKKVIYAQNTHEIAQGDKTIAISGVTVVDGTGSEPIKNALVIVKNNKIDYVGKASDATIPEDAEVIDASGMTLLPGLIDAHFHGESNKVTPLFLKKGVTSIRDPGAWNESYDEARGFEQAIPRLFLTGPHIDSYPPAYPLNSFLIQDPLEGEIAVNRFADEGATAIKAYFRLSTEMIKVICETAHKRGIPVTAHLEITNAIDAINAGLDGIEHITSFGTSLLTPSKAEVFKNKMLGDNSARRKGRYEVWNTLDIDNNPRVDSIVPFLAEHQTFISPTLAVFEKQFDKGDSTEVNAFANMLKFVGRINKGGAKIVVGSHTFAPYAELGNAYYREMELLKEAGLSNMEVIVAATLENARFFRIEERLGSIEKGKIADLIILRKNPLDDLKAMNTVEKVMLNGVFIDLN